MTAIPARLCRIGVRPLGQPDYGRNYGLLYDVAGWTDVLPEFGNDSYEAADNFMTGRANGLLTYHNRSLAAGRRPRSGLQYQGRIGGRRSTGEGYPDANGDGYAFSATYDTGVGSTLAALRQLCAHPAQQRFGTADGDRAWPTLGLKYDQTTSTRRQATRVPRT